MAGLNPNACELPTNSRMELQCSLVVNNGNKLLLLTLHEIGVLPKSLQGNMYKNIEACGTDGRDKTP